MAVSEATINIIRRGSVAAILLSAKKGLSVHDSPILYLIPTLLVRGRQLLDSISTASESHGSGNLKHLVRQLPPGQMEDYRSLSLSR